MYSNLNITSCCVRAVRDLRILESRFRKIIENLEGVCGTRKVNKYCFTLPSFTHPLLPSGEKSVNPVILNFPYAFAYQNCVENT
jgi:hypothetical protein